MNKKMAGFFGAVLTTIAVIAFLFDDQDVVLWSVLFAALCWIEYRLAEIYEQVKKR